ncbi:MAG: DMT family transporter [candidate division WOR-3 bacterium]
MPINFPFLGETLALLSALFWALAVIFFKKSGERTHPLGLNFFKNFLALILFLPTLTLLGEPLVPRVSLSEFALFFLSGLLGMSVGDTLFFASLNRLGAGISAIISYTYSPLLIGLSLFFLKENLRLIQILGIILILFALLLTTQIKLPEKVKKRTLLLGIALGLLSTAATAIGVILIKPLLAKNSLFVVTAIRLFAGLVGVSFFILFLPNRKEIIKSAFARKGFGYNLGGAIFGTYIALTIWLGGMKFTPVSIAAPLNQLSNIFIFLLAALILKEPFNRERVFALIFAFIGALLVIIG